MVKQSSPLFNIFYSNLYILNLQGLETTAIYDKERDEFVINTPKVSSTKFWPGDLGLTSTHSVVYAQLIIDGKNHGV